MDQSVPVQNRRSSRSNVLLKASIDCSGVSHSVILRNLSQEGALVSGEDLPPPGTQILFHRQGLCVPSRVAWTHCGLCGLEFEFPLFPRELLRHIPSSESRPTPVPINRRPGLAAKPLSPAERAMIERWATEAVNLLGE